MHMRRKKSLPEELVFSQEDPKVQLVSDVFREYGINHEFQKFEREFGKEYQIVFFQIEFKMRWNFSIRSFCFGVFFQVILKMIIGNQRPRDEKREVEDVIKEIDGEKKKRFGLLFGI